ncbi:GNAT family N-acetyltransferase [Deinococcus multiflagellatus]|uniref:GNAT family N-acetyltransferase n=1 Tax=Deinococcus multiflagellatus TaxID=1656887 RepID=A0ABW1ZN91_9DEIO|nr:GNAT family N-acetyltransferase [Deinococcus multiflagellatus]MBZ9712381.1 GNAT family N-acetyltransferase [Deinococcus multiflagellatus]
MSPFTIRRLGPGDEAALARLAADETDFTDEAPSPPLSPEAARAYLADPQVWHWHAEDGQGQPVGFLMAYVHRRRHGEALDVMFEEIGVLEAWRRRGVGRALVAALHGQMRAQGIRGVWVAADNEGAQAFYRACGYEVDELQGVILSRTV